MPCSAAELCALTPSAKGKPSACFTVRFTARAGGAGYRCSWSFGPCPTKRASLRPREKTPADHPGCRSQALYVHGRTFTPRNPASVSASGNTQRSCPGVRRARPKVAVRRYSVSWTALLAEKPTDKANHHVNWFHRGTTVLAPLRRRGQYSPPGPKVGPNNG